MPPADPRLQYPVIANTSPEVDVEDEDILINPTVQFIIGGPDGDTG